MAMNYIIPPYERFSIPREVLIFFISTRQEYLLRTLYYAKHYRTPEGHGTDQTYIDPVEVGKALGVSTQTIKNHVSKLLDLGLLKPSKRSKFLYYIYGHKSAVKAVRRLQDTTSFTLGVSKDVEAKKFIARMQSSYLSGYRFQLSILFSDRAEFRTVLQGAIYTHNIKQQNYQQYKKSGGHHHVPNIDGAETGEEGLISCTYAGELIGRSKMSGSRLRKQLEKSGVVHHLKDNTQWLGHCPTWAGLEGLRIAHPDKTLIPIPAKSKPGFFVMVVECTKTILPSRDKQVVKPYRIRSHYRGKRKTDRMTVTTGSNCATPSEASEAGIENGL